MDYGVPDDADVGNGKKLRAAADSDAHSGRSQNDPDEQVECKAGLHASVIIIEPRLLARECLAQGISSQSGFDVRTFASIAQWRSSDGPADGHSIVLLSLGGTLGETGLNNPLSSVVADAAVPVVILAEDEDPACIAEVLQSGARGYVSTNLSLAGTVRALRFVADGGTFVPASSLLNAYKRIELTKADSARQGMEIFTPRQSAVVKALCSGKPNKVIAFELDMCESTVKVHVRNIMKKLKAKNRTEVAIMAQKLRESPVSEVRANDSEFSS